MFLRRFKFGELGAKGKKGGSGGPWVVGWIGILGQGGRDVVGPKNFSSLTSLEFAIIWMHAQTTNLPK